jgi:biotin transport system substrate-specific component
METAYKKTFGIPRVAQKTAAIALFVLLTAVGACIRIPLPFSPVPITLQTFFVLLAGAFLGSGFGALSQLFYILLGVSGLSLFTGSGSGLPYFFGPTGGYLCGFVVAAFFVGRSIVSLRKNYVSVFALFCAAELTILCLGALWLSVFFGYHLKEAVLVGLLPFVPGDICKALLATAVYLKVHSFFKTRDSVHRRN